ncbi:hypothetical protein GUJ93_ZPchr0001g32644 [Zizania palustris]|uniref:Uncharacterized protein n=1 Tax=Zizania palustris TaxID=103762 RepID=A0A8J5RYD8_ZIZPA|nr:hypothetical protein GUJ93_ZPchr0001g32644 [Zizania palustris]
MHLINIGRNCWTAKLVQYLLAELDAELMNSNTEISHSRKGKGDFDPSDFLTPSIPGTNKMPSYPDDFIAAVLVVVSADHGSLNPINHQTKPIQAVTGHPATVTW